jgi:hypothetical protein
MIIIRNNFFFTEFRTTICNFIPIESTSNTSSIFSNCCTSSDRCMKQRFIYFSFQISFHSEYSTATNSSIYEKSSCINNNNTECHTTTTTFRYFSSCKILIISFEETFFFFFLDNNNCCSITTNFKCFTKN